MSKTDFASKDLKDRVADLETVKSGTISGSLNFSIQWVKKGKVVVLNITNDTTKIPKGETELATLPNFLRPILVIYSECHIAYINKCSFRLSSATGKLTLYCDIATGSSSPYYVTCSMTYLTS